MVPNRNRWDVTLFADDVKLRKNRVDTMNKLLKASEDCALIYGMKWAPEKCRKIMYTGPHETSLAFILINQEVLITKAATYLGITATPTEVADDETRQRLHQAINRVQAL